MPDRDSIPVERSTVNAMLGGAVATRGAGHVDELVLADAIMDDGQTPRRHKSTCRGCRQAEFVGPAFGRKTPLDHAERGFCFGRLGWIR